ncbi:hypothetical protein BL250_12425 [Erwinia sp. OLTSP20]|uniref:hypothetical protein n=1 Tax=Enterobacterales TaxID=91347 RepID=UPI000C5EE835|nr:MULTISPECIES: hypothetical protein [Enterobacterales]PII85141.1 hypothetical protein BMF91_23990 [Serratia sp. OLFL2]PIJ49367.1 hypothetical protein BV501_13085 [Erwinia sp. OAMSP11]PIJ69762.1 hypothetical protein BK416_13915 [Erwinia sp. OLSSP12]PIJ76246.1 hypothetical protein BLD47_18170 [Erwinia sp. OLCASP19]PIJ76729.1 hypothetical protein BLD46_18170 [Erwinia sp. OLMTSP26]
MMDALKIKIARLALWLTPQRYFTGLTLVCVALAPQMASAAWYDPILTFAREFKTGLIVLGGIAALCSMVYCGIGWLVSRMVGSMEIQFFDYLKTAGVIGVVGGSVALATWAYSLWGGTITS